MHLESTTPKKPEIFWCSKCDSEQVDSDKPETGKFFVQFGHAYSMTTRAYDGEYTGVMFALCHACNK